MGIVGKGTRNRLALQLGYAVAAALILGVIMTGPMHVVPRAERGLLDSTESNNIGMAIPLAPGQSNTVLKNDAPNAGVQLVTLYLSAFVREQSNDFGGSLPGFFGGLGSHMVKSPGRVVALVTFGVGGGEQQVFVSVKNGTALTFTASSVRVDAYYNEDPAALPTPPRLTVAALLSYGARPSTGTPYDPAVFEVRWDSPAGDLAALDVPPFARALTVATDDAALGVSSIRIEFSGGFPAVQLASYQGVANQKVITVPVPDGATGVEIVNGAVTPVNNGMAMWHLGL